eukprot:8171305-Lingulodinium_polyedra.AAC.1
MRRFLRIWRPEREICPGFPGLHASIRWIFGIWGAGFTLRHRHWVSKQSKHMVSEFQRQKRSTGPLVLSPKRLQNAARA